MTISVVLLGFVISSIHGEIADNRDGITTSTPTDALPGSILFTSLHSGDLLRLDHCGVDGCAEPVVIATNLTTYGGLLPWKGGLLASSRNRLVVQIDPWCHNSSCPVTQLVNVTETVASNDSSFYLAGLAWCHDSLYVAFGSESQGGGVLRCANCSPGRDCTSRCLLIDGGAGTGKGQHQLSRFAADIACEGDRVLVLDSTNFRVQSIPVACARAPCDVGTFASDLKWPLGIAVIDGGRRVLVTLDEGIVSLRSDGTLLHKDWSSRDDSGFLREGGGRIFVASGGDGNIVSFDPACEGPNCRETLVWNSTGSNAKSGGAIAYLPYSKVPINAPPNILV